MLKLDLLRPAAASLTVALAIAAPATVAQERPDGVAELLPVRSRTTPKLSATLTPVDRPGGGAAYASGCSPVVRTYADSNFEGTFIGTIPPGMVETEMLAVSFTAPAGEFPLLLNTTDMIFSQVHFNETVTQYTYMVWEGTPDTGTLIASFSSDGLILPHVTLPVGGSQAVNLQITVDPGDPEQILIMDDGTQTFSVGFRIDAHNNPPTSDCTDIICEIPAICCPPDAQTNAWPSMDQALGPNANKNWLWTRACPGVNFPFCVLASGWYRHDNAILAGYVNDWALCATYTPLGACSPGGGACCLTDGGCSFVTLEDCNLQGGTFQGVGITCAAANCTVPLGACCIDGGCVETLEVDCTVAGGVWNVGEDCLSFDCDPPGACCIPASGGCLSFTESVCVDTVGGIWQGPNTDCGSVVCFPIGACCLGDGSCTPDQSPEDCAAAGGTFQGDGTTCGGVSCPPPFGACCLSNGNCVVVSEADCGVLVGTWSGMGSDCADADQNGTADACEGSCLGDIDEDGMVGFSDLLEVLSNWGPCVACPQDLDGDDDVGFSDLLEVLSRWGPC